LWYCALGSLSFSYLGFFGIRIVFNKSSSLTVFSLSSYSSADSARNYVFLLSKGLANNYDTDGRCVLLTCRHNAMNFCRSFEYLYGILSKTPF
jgi:hypothetical protein